MKVTYQGKTFECATAYRGPDYVRLVDSAGLSVATFEGVRSFGYFIITDGEWTFVPEANDCDIAVISPDGAIKASGKRLCDASKVYGTFLHIGLNLRDSETIDWDGTCRYWQIPVTAEQLHLDNIPYVQELAEYYSETYQVSLMNLCHIQPVSIADGGGGGLDKVKIELSGLSDTDLTIMVRHYGEPPNYTVLDAYIFMPEHYVEIFS